MEEKLSIRKAESVAGFLRREMNVKIATSAIRYKTPLEVAEMVLGSKAHKSQINELAKKICGQVNIPVG